jgi:hypothetical protein
MEVSIGVVVQHTKIVMNKSAVIVARLNNAILNPRQLSKEMKMMIKTACYKCGSEIEVLSDRLVHPLCGECQESFDDWFERELSAIERCGK